MQGVELTKTLTTTEIAKTTTKQIATFLYKLHHFPIPKVGSKYILSYNRIGWLNRYKKLQLDSTRFLNKFSFEKKLLLDRWFKYFLNGNIDFDLALLGPSLASLAIATAMAATSAAYADVTLLNVSYDPTRELYKAINAALVANWKAKTGETVTIQTSHAAPAPRRGR